MKRLLALASAELRRRAPFIAAFGLVLSLATIAVPPSEAIWFQVLSGDVHVTTNGFPTAVLPTSVGPTLTTSTTTATPNVTTTPTATNSPAASPSAAVTLTPGASSTPASSTTPGTATTPVPTATLASTTTPGTTLTPARTLTPAITRTPEPTASPCTGGSLDSLHFQGDVSLTGAGPFQAQLVISNDGPETAHAVLLGFATLEGWSYLSRVDFGNTQYWLIDGQPGATLYSVGDLPPGAQTTIILNVTMSSDWASAASGADAVLGAGVTDFICPDAEGAVASITLIHQRGDATETPEPSATSTAKPSSTPTDTETPVPSQTAAPTQTVVATTTALASATPEPSATPNAPTATSTIAATDTATPELRSPTATRTRTPVVTATPTIAGQATPTPGATGTVLAAVATPPSTNQVLGDAATPARSGPVLPATGNGRIAGRFGSQLAGFVLLAVTIGLVGVAVGVGRRRT